MNGQEFTDKVYIVSGSSSGIGKSCALALLQEGARVAGIDLKAGTIEDPGYTHYESGITDEKSIKRIVRDTAEKYGRIDGLVNAVAPGFTYTGMTKASFDNETVRTQSEALIPNGRLGVPEDISNVVLFLLSDGADYINGTNICADGGYHIQK